MSAFENGNGDGVPDNLAQPVVPEKSVVDAVPGIVFTPAPAGSVEESVDHAVNMGINAWNDARFDEAAAWFRDAAAHCDRVKKERREQYERDFDTAQRTLLEKTRV